MISRTNQGAGFALVLVCLLTLPAAFARPMAGVTAGRLAIENEAKLIESVSSHLKGVADLRRHHTRQAIRSFKASQVLLSECLTNSTLLVGRVAEPLRSRLQFQLAELRERTQDLSARNSALIKSLEAQETPPPQTLQELTRNMVAVIGFGLEVASAPKAKSAP